MNATQATNGAAQMTRRFDTKREAFEYSATEANVLIFDFGYFTCLTRQHPNYFHVTDFYVVPFSSVEWAEACRMRLVVDFGDLM